MSDVFVCISIHKPSLRSLSVNHGSNGSLAGYNLSLVPRLSPQRRGENLGAIGYHHLMWRV